jgi:uncharacterized protein
MLKSQRRTSRALLAAVSVCVVAGLSGCGDDDENADVRTTTTTTGGTSVVVGEKSQVPRYGGSEDARRDPRTRRQRVLEDLPRADKADDEALAPKIRGSEGQTVAQFLDTVGNDVATFWQQQFNTAAYTFEPVDQFITTGGGRTRCSENGAYTPDVGPFYCSIDPAIHLPVEFFVSEAVPVGDAAVAIVVAHEWGHRVQDVVGILDAERNGVVKGRQTELQADCLAGVWVSTVWQRNALEEGDITEALEMSRRGGDDPQMPHDHPAAHGSGEQRMEAFLRGFENSSSGGCVVEQF